MRLGLLEGCRAVDDPAFTRPLAKLSNGRWETGEACLLKRHMEASDDATAGGFQFVCRRHYLLRQRLGT